MSLSPITMPTLVLHGARDGCMGGDLLDGMEALFPAGLRKVVVPDAGHFLHQERPDEVNRAVLEFLGHGTTA
jgi:pimeloyl-ACP methyl ester carboxylesterase